MTVLGIETSCDETAGSVCHDGAILSSIIFSQDIHSQFGGVVPEIASREHESRLTAVVGEALRVARVSKADIDAVAVTRGPGLMGSLLTGVSFARGFAHGLGIPCLGINHIEAHIFANFIAHEELKYPFLCLLVSGGHTQIWKVTEMGSYKLLGETRDDAAGEAFDKGARILGLGFPGGPEIEQAAQGGDEDAVRFPRSFLQTEEIEFSFSGLKTSLMHYVRDRGKAEVVTELSHVTASYQKAIVEVLIHKLRQAVDSTGVKRVIIAGGVAANSRLRLEAEKRFEDCTVFYPPVSLCTDNAAMVAYLGEKILLRDGTETNDLSVVPNLRLVH